MPADLLIAFARPPGEDPAAAAAQWRGRCAAALALVPGVLATRSFAVNVVLGKRPPAFLPALVMCELDGGYDAHAAQAALASPNEPAVAAWEATSIGDRSDFELPDHLYLQFSAHPASLTFDQYSDWYQVHQDENIAQSAVLVRGWRYRLERLGAGEAPGPTHLALYQLDGDLETLTGDLGRAMEAGAISLPDWFTRFASLEGIAAGERTPR